MLIQIPQVLLICINLGALFLHVSTAMSLSRNAVGQWKRFQSLGRGGKTGVCTGGRHPLFAYPFALPVPRCSRIDDCNRHSIGLVYKVRMCGSQTYIALNGPSFQALCARGAAFVDKTGAIADLMCKHMTSRAFFVRPRRFGKSLTLDIMAAMLSAGDLPEGVQPWRSYSHVDIDRLFEGLAVHRRMDGDPAIHALLHQVHFVVRLNLGEARSGAELEPAIMDALGNLAREAFSEELEKEVRSSSTLGRALRRLILEVPPSVPVAVLVDEYDAAIIRDVCKDRWDEADSGLDALRSLMMSTKTSGAGDRIRHFVVSGVARFATSLFSAANNFQDITNESLVSAALGFSEDEIRSCFGDELDRLARSRGETSDGTLALLARWYGGYRFDGTTSCFNPFPVLVALGAGNLTMQEMEGIPDTNWLGLSPEEVVAGMARDLSGGRMDRLSKVDVADLERGSVNVKSLLLQKGLLTLSRVPGDSRAVYCEVPNEYARESLQTMLGSMFGDDIRGLFSEYVTALEERDPDGFTSILRLLALKGRGPSKRQGPSAEEEGNPLEVWARREGLFHAALWAMLYVCVPPSLASVTSERQVWSGRANLVLSFTRDPREVWVIEVGVDASVDEKLEQAQSHAQNFPGDVLCWAIVVNSKEPQVVVEWSRRKRDADGAVSFVRLG